MKKIKLDAKAVKVQCQCGRPALKNKELCRECLNMAKLATGFCTLTSMVKHMEADATCPKKSKKNIVKSMIKHVADAIKNKGLCCF